MENTSPSPNLTRVALVIALGILIGGGAWYIAHLRGENAELRSQTGGGEPQRPAAAAPAAPAGQPGAGADRSLSAEQRQAMLERLKAETGPERKVWFATTSSPEAVEFQRAIQGTFEAAGWQVMGNEPVGFALKPGIFFFMADVDPPAYVLSALDSFDAAGMSVMAGRGYREFYAEKAKSDPNWVGFDMAPDQTYVIVIGPKPPA